MYCLHLFACSLRTFSVLLFKKESRNRTSFRLCPIPCNHFNLYVCSAVVSFSLISCPVLMWAEPWVCTWSPSPRSLYNVKWYSCVPLIGFSANLGLVCECDEHNMISIPGIGSNLEQWQSIRVSLLVDQQHRIVMNTLYSPTFETGTMNWETSQMHPLNKYFALKETPDRVIIQFVVIREILKLFS